MASGLALNFWVMYSSCNIATSHKSTYHGLRKLSVYKRYPLEVYFTVSWLHCCYGDQCAVAMGDRELCMFEGVTQTVCENEGCCYDDGTTPNCYYSNYESTYLFSTSFLNKILSNESNTLCLHASLIIFFIQVAGFKRRKGYCLQDDITTGSVMTLSQCSNTCLRNSSLVAFLYDFNTNKCKLLTTLCKQTTVDDTNYPDLYMYDQCKCRSKFCIMAVYVDNQHLYMYDYGKWILS